MQSKLCHVHIIHGAGIGVVAFITTSSEKLFMGKEMLQEESLVRRGHYKISRAVVCGCELLLTPSESVCYRKFYFLF